VLTKCTQYPTGIGTPIRACASGKWKETGYMKYGYGNYVILEHENGYETVYGHLSSTAFKPGYIDIARGDIVGYSGNTGKSLGPHLHFELRKDGIKIDPNLGFKEAEKLLEWARARAIMQVENKGSITHMGNRVLRTLLVEAAWSAIRKDARLRQFYFRIKINFVKPVEI